MFKTPYGVSLTYIKAHQLNSYYQLFRCPTKLVCVLGYFISRGIAILLYQPKQEAKGRLSTNGAR